jgi:DNA-directed RNA polymerase subunit RPC12/RpoP
MPTLSVLCHACGQEFLSDVPIEEAGARGPLAEGRVYECPYCGTEDPYFSSDYHGAKRDERASDPIPRRGGRERLRPDLAANSGLRESPPTGSRS